MGKRVSLRQKRKEAPDWVFPWRSLGESTFSSWFALIFVGCAFALLLTSVRLKVTPPAPWAGSKASIIHAGIDAVGRELALRAREGGPFPSRFELSDWDGAAALEQAAFSTVTWSPPPYEPTLQTLPERGNPPIRLAATGELVLPKLNPSVTSPPPDATRLKPTPVLYPLSGSGLSILPETVPAYDGPVDKSLTTEPQRFLIRLDGAGHVLDCFPLASREVPGPSPLEPWLRGLSFLPDLKQTTRWIALGVGFANLPADGTDAR